MVATCGLQPAARAMRPRLLLVPLILFAARGSAQVQAINVFTEPTSGFFFEYDPVYTDVDGDGKVDIVIPTTTGPTVPTRQGLRAYSLEGPQSQLLWASEPWDARASAGLFAADITGDGRLEFGRQGGVLTGGGSVDFSLHAYDATGSLLPGYPLDASSFPSGKVTGAHFPTPKFARLRESRFGPLPLHRLVTDAQLEIQGKPRRSHVFLHTGVDPREHVALRPSKPSAGMAPPWLFSESAVGDVDGDGHADIVFRARHYPFSSVTPTAGYFYLMSARKSLTYPGWPLPANRLFTHFEPFSMANMDDDRRTKEMVVFNSDSANDPTIFVLNTGGAVFETSSFTIATLKMKGSNGSHGEAVFTDPGSDGRSELLVQSPWPTFPWWLTTLKLLELRSSGLAPAPGWTSPTYVSVDPEWDPMVVGDVEGNGTPDVVLATRSDLNTIQVHAFDETGMPVAGYPVAIPYENSAFTLALVEGLTTPGRYDIVVTRSSYLYLAVDVFKIPTAGIPGPNDWPVYRHDYGRSGNAAAR